MNTDNIAGSKNWTAERSDAGPSMSEGERQGWREHKHRSKNGESGFAVLSVFIRVHPWFQK
ncbi:MAG: hypothetical protein Tsb0026_13980 [Sulfuricaulis sp.]